MSSKIFPEARFETSSDNLSMANLAVLGLRPFSNLLEASVFRPSFVEVCLIFVGLKLQTDKTIFLVSLSIPELIPPLIPATSNGFSESEITNIPSSNSKTFPSKTVIFSPRDPLLPQESYTLLVTSRVSSPDRIPVATFLAVYRTLEGDFDPELDQILAEAEEEEEEGLPEEAPPESSGEDPRPISEEPPVPGRVVLNEIFYDAVGSDTDGILFVELYGTPGMALGGFRIVFVDGGDGSVDDSITLPGEAEIGADGFYLVADSGTGQAASEVSGADLVDNFDPQNGPDAVQLLDSLGELADAVAYGNGVVPLAENGLAAFEGTAAPDVINGHSLERREPGLDIDNNLADFVDREAPSPGR